MSRLVAIALLLACAGPALASGERIAVRIDEPFEINGKLYSPGQLSVRVLREYTPTRTLNELWVDNERVGMMLATRESTELSEVEDSIVFERPAGRHLVLVGHTLAGQDPAGLYRYATAERKGRSVGAIGSN
jgi:hypothetical protein